MGVLCATAENGVWIKRKDRKERKKVQRRLLRPSDIPVSQTILYRARVNVTDLRARQRDGYENCTASDARHFTDCY